MVFRVRYHHSYYRCETIDERATPADRWCHRQSSGACMRCWYKMEMSYVWSVNASNNHYISSYTSTSIIVAAYSDCTASESRCDRSQTIGRRLVTRALEQTATEPRTRAAMQSMSRADAKMLLISVLRRSWTERSTTTNSRMYDMHHFEAWMLYQCGCVTCPRVTLCSFNLMSYISVDL